MSCMSELAYIRFNPLLRGRSVHDLIKYISGLEDDKDRINPRYIKKLEAILDIVGYDHEQEREKLEQELELLEYRLVQTFDNEGTQAILMANDQYAVLAFRGTEATSIKDIKSDVKAVIKEDDSGGKIHSGFEEASQKVWLDIEAALEGGTVREKPLFITGHSLGGGAGDNRCKENNPPGRECGLLHLWCAQGR